MDLMNALRVISTITSLEIGHLGRIPQFIKTKEHNHRLHRNPSHYALLRPCRIALFLSYVSSAPHRVTVVEESAQKICEHAGTALHAWPHSEIIPCQWSARSKIAYAFIILLRTSPLNIPIRSSPPTEQPQNSPQTNYIPFSSTIGSTIGFSSRCWTESDCSVVYISKRTNMHLPLLSKNQRTHIPTSYLLFAQARYDERWRLDIIRTWDNRTSFIVWMVAGN